MSEYIMNSITYRYDKGGRTVADGGKNVQEDKIPKSTQVKISETLQMWPL